MSETITTKSVHPRPSVLNTKKSVLSPRETVLNPRPSVLSPREFVQNPKEFVQYTRDSVQNTTESVPNTKDSVTNTRDFPNILCLKLLNCDRRCPMAKDSHRDISKLNEGDIKPVETRSLVDITLECVTGKGSKDLVVGTLLGWLGGLALVRVGRVAAFGLGGGVILLHFASEGGYINVNWEKVKEASHRSQDIADTMIRFVKLHSCYSVGFLGGFFFGVAST